MNASPIDLEFVFEARIRLAPALELGAAQHGRRRVIPIVGGTVTGPRLSGTIRPGGADWQLIRADGVAEIEARYTIEAADGTLIAVVNRGRRHGPPEVMERLLRGAMVDPASYYFRTAPVFEAPSGPHDWLNRSLFLGHGTRLPEAVLIRVFAVG
jgi:hypothetical protein